MRKAKLDANTKEDPSELAENATGEPEKADPGNTVGAAKDSEFWKDIITVPGDVKNDEKKLKQLQADVSRLAVVLKGSDPKLTHIPQADCWFKREGETTIDHLGIAFKIPRKVDKAQTTTLKEAIRDQRGLNHVSAPKPKPGVRPAE